MKAVDCQVIGGGLVGLFTALELQQRGLHVRVLERGTIGRESSWAGGGILSPLQPWNTTQPVTALVDHARSIYPGICNRLLQATGIDPEYRLSGMLITGLPQTETDKLLDWAEQQKQPVCILKDRHLHDLEPQLHPDVHTAILLESAAQVRNPRLLQALYKYLLQQGVEILEGTEVAGLQIQQDKIMAVKTSRDMDLSAEFTVVTSGAWSTGLVPDYPVKPIRGQMLAIQAQPGMLSHILMQEGYYLIPRQDGLILVGSSQEDAGFHKETTQAVRDQLLQVATGLLPGIDQFPLRHHWSGLRPATPTGIPYICKHSRVKNLYLNFGHYRNGILLAPAAAELLADILQGKTSFVATDQFNLRSDAVVNA